MDSSDGEAVVAASWKRQGDYLDRSSVTLQILGMDVGERDNEMLLPSGVKDAHRVAVVGILNGGAADRAGVTRGDVILKVNGDQICNLDDLHRAFAGLSTGEYVCFLMLRTDIYHLTACRYG